MGSTQYLCPMLSQSQLSKDSGQTGMGEAATPKCKEAAYWTNRGRNKVGASDQKFSDHHPFYFSYNATSVFYSAIKVEKRAWGAFPLKNVHNYIP